MTDDYDARKDAHDSYFAAIEEKRKRGDADKPPTETNLVRECLLRATQIGGRLIRQQTGTGWIGKVNKRPDGSVIIQNARPFHSGFPGWSDSGGFASVTITPDMVGQKIAVYVQAEVKTKNGTVRNEQRQWISFVRSIGGRAGIARSADDVERIMRGDLVD